MSKDPKRVAAGKRSKNKGNNFERKIAKKLQEWWGRGEFVRTPSSGGWSTQAVREGFRAVGDIMTTEEDFPFCVECKFHKDWSIDQYFTSPKSFCVEQWWEQAVEETPTGLKPLLIAKANRKPILVFLKEDYCFLALRKAGIMARIYLEISGSKILCILFEDFLKLDPEDLGKLVM